MNKMLRRLLPLFCALWLPLAASADSVDEKTVALVNGAGGVALEMTPEEEPAVWEYPLLEGGTARRAGTLRLVNNSDKTVDFRLSGIQLPYGDEEALTYLNSLLITVKEGDAVLYDGSFSHIADADGGLTIAMEGWKPGEERVLTISMRCLFTYTGDPLEVSKPITWEYAASFTGSGEGTQSLLQPPVDDAERPVVAMIVICVAGGLIILCAVLGAVGVLVRKKRER